MTNPTEADQTYQVAREEASRSITDLLSALDAVYRLAAGTAGERHRDRIQAEYEAASRNAYEAHRRAGEAWRRTR